MNAVETDSPGTVHSNRVRLVLVSVWTRLAVLAILLIVIGFVVRTDPGSAELFTLLAVMVFMFVVAGGGVLGAILLLVWYEHLWYGQPIARRVGVRLLRIAAEAFVLSSTCLLVAQSTKEYCERRLDRVSRAIVGEMLEIRDAKGGAPTRQEFELARARHCGWNDEWMVNRIGFLVHGAQEFRITAWSVRNWERSAWFYSEEGWDPELLMAR